ncbi:7653_t:CDS:2, partial [Acaulospora morrowiae]
HYPQVGRRERMTCIFGDRPNRRFYKIQKLPAGFIMKQIIDTGWVITPPQVGRRDMTRIFGGHLINSAKYKIWSVKAPPASGAK